MSIEKNTYTRRIAGEILREIADRVFLEADAIDFLHLYQCIIEGFQRKFPQLKEKEQPPPVERLTPGQVKTFEEEKITFGKHDGKPIREIPLHYLIWLNEQPDFRRRLRAYINSDKIQEEIKRNG